MHVWKLRNLYYLSENIRMIKSRRKKMEGHETCMKELRNAYIILAENPQGKARPTRR